MQPDTLARIQVLLWNVAYIHFINLSLSKPMDSFGMWWKSNEIIFLIES